MNKHYIGGVIKNDVELINTSNDKYVVNLLVQTQDKFTDKHGKVHIKRCTHQLEVWDKTAKMVAENYKKGSYIIAIGRSETKKYKDNYITKVIVNSVEDINRTL